MGWKHVAVVKFSFELSFPRRYLVRVLSQINTHFLAGAAAATTENKLVPTASLFASCNKQKTCETPRIARLSTT